MKIQEYQAKELLAEKGVPVPKGQALSSATEARGVARDLGGAVVVKAQVLAGGRGKAGGIKLAATPKKAAEATRSILGTRISILHLALLWRCLLAGRYYPLCAQARHGRIRLYRIG